VLPGNLNLTYTYDARGQLISLTDWDNQTTRLGYDGLGRQVRTERQNGVTSQYAYSARGHLSHIRHRQGNRTLAQFSYQTDRRGNRTQAQEMLLHPATTADVTYAFNDPTILYRGTWSAANPYQTTTGFTDSLALGFVGQDISLTYGTGPDHSIFDVYIDGSLWRSLDGYNATATDQTVTINLTEDGVHVFEIRNRAEKRSASTGYRVRFRSLLVVDRAFSFQTINYTYDRLARVRDVDYYAGATSSGTPFRSYDYTFDRSGNRTQQSLSLNGGAPTVTTYTYNTANQLTSDGTTTTTYDPNGNLLTGTTWDRANRMLSFGGASHKYDGEGRRIQQTVAAQVTQYLLDLQPGLSVVLSETTSANVTRYVHGPRGIHAQKDSGGTWDYMLQDGLGSVRSVVDNAATILDSRNYDPYGNPFSVVGTTQTGYGFTGELMDGGGLLDLRARRYNTGLGTFASLDPFEGLEDEPMSLNGYSYVHGNPVNWTDPSGEILPILIGGILIGAVTGWAWNVFVEQGYGGGGENSRGISGWDALFRANEIFEYGLRCANQEEALGRAIQGAFIAAPTAVAAKLAFLPAVVGAGTNFLVGLASGNYSGEGGTERAALDIYIGFVFGGIGGGFLNRHTLYVSRSVSAGGVTRSGFASFQRIMRQGLSRAIGYGVINATQGISRRVIGNSVLNEDSDVTTIADEALLNFSIGFGGTLVLDGIATWTVFEDTLRPTIHRFSEIRTVLDNLNVSASYFTLGIVTQSNITPALLQLLVDAIEQAERNALIRDS
jgi:RHS repeat-associated protein